MHIKQGYRTTFQWLSLGMVEVLGVLDVKKDEFWRRTGGHA